MSEFSRSASSIIMTLLIIAMGMVIFGVIVELIERGVL